MIHSIRRKRSWLLCSMFGAFCRGILRQNAGILGSVVGLVDGGLSGRISLVSENRPTSLPSSILPALLRPEQGQLRSVGIGHGGHWSSESEEGRRMRPAPGRVAGQDDREFRVLEDRSALPECGGIGLQEMRSGEPPQAHRRKPLFPGRRKMGGLCEEQAIGGREIRCIALDQDSAATQAWRA
jgi:hypothetical protein